MDEASTREELPALIQGASRGIGAELVRQLLERGRRVIATCRDPASSASLQALSTRHGSRLQLIELDLVDEASIAKAVTTLQPSTPRLGLLMNVAGVLHAPEHRPERRLDEVDPAWLTHVFAVNGLGPLLVAKHFAPLLRHRSPAVLANISARVGSIADNRLGGWYAYRGSKAAQNMFTKTLSIELTRRNPELVVLALHPGTVATDLSAPFQRSVPAGKLFEVERAARQLLAIVDAATPADNGSFLAWDGQPIPW